LAGGEIPPAERVEAALEHAEGAEQLLAEAGWVEALEGGDGAGVAAVEAGLAEVGEEAAEGGGESGAGSEGGEAREGAGGLADGVVDGAGELAQDEVAGGGLGALGGEDEVGEQRGGDDAIGADGRARGQGARPGAQRLRGLDVGDQHAGTAGGQRVGVGGVQ
jgi:hypothetical protein